MNFLITHLWFSAGSAVTLALAPCAAMSLHGSPERRLVGMQMAGILVIIAMLLFTRAFDRAIFVDLPLALAVMSFGGGLVFARFLEKHL